MEQFDIKQKVLQFLDQNSIPYEHHEHKRAHTIEECLRMPFITDEITICKNILLCNRQQTQFYLLLLKPLTPFRTAVVSKALGASRLSFAPVEYLEEKLRLKSGSVSPLGLLFDFGHEIRLCYEESVMETSKIAFHPCDNTATIIFEQDVFWNQVIPLLKTDPICLSVSACAQSD